MTMRTLVVTQTVAYYGRDEESVEEILAAVEAGEWETKHNEVTFQRVRIYEHENGVDAGTLVYDSGEELDT